MARPLGMMSGCYFVGRAELLSWINGLLGLNYDKVEDTANGAAFCQIIDALHPGSITLGRVNYDARTEAEMVENYKILQDGFSKNGITQYIDVPTLCKGRYMAALEFFQWIHGYFEQMGGAPDYDGVARRKHAKCKEPTERGRPDKKPAGMAKRQGAIALAPSAKARAAALAEAKAEPKAEPRPKPVKKADPPAPKQPKPAPVASEAKEAKRGKVAKLEEDLEQAVQERDFYYEKLRRVEDFCQENENDPQLKQILEILYEADPSRGFLPPEEED